MTNQTGLNILFAGTPEFAAAHLRALLEHTNHRVLAVYTQPDRPAGRGKKVHASPVKQVAEDAGLAVEQPTSLKDPQAQSTLADYQADLLVVVAYGLLLPKAVLDTPRLGCINVHASLLPRWRGAAPIQRAIEAGDTQSGVTIMQMDEGLDTGDMLLKATCPITPEDTASDLHDRLITVGCPALLTTVDQLQSGLAQGQPQPTDGVVYAHKLSKDEAKIDWQLPAEQIARKIRAFNPFPMAHAQLGQDRMRILHAHTSESSTPAAPPGTLQRVERDALIVACAEHTSLALTHIQLPGKKAMSVRDVLNGSSHLFVPGTPLAS